jgi:hypothetical protein
MRCAGCWGLVVAQAWEPSLRMTGKPEHLRLSGQLVADAADWKREDPQIHRAQERSFRQRAGLDRLRSAIEVGWTPYYNARGLMKLKGQRSGASGGNYVDMATASRFGFPA